MNGGGDSLFFFVQNNARQPEISYRFGNLAKKVTGDWKSFEVGKLFHATTFATGMIKDLPWWYSVLMIGKRLETALLSTSATTDKPTTRIKKKN